MGFSFGDIAKGVEDVAKFIGQGVGGLVAGGSAPAPIAPPAPPSPVDPTSANSQAMQEAEDEQKKKRGMAANELTGGSGTSYAPQTSRAVLLGN